MKQIILVIALLVCAACAKENVGAAARSWCEQEKNCDCKDERCNWDRP